MDPRTGELYRLDLDDDVQPGDLIAARDAHAADEEAKAKLEALLAEKGGEDRPLVAVDGEVVQKLRLGEKELRRRRQRRR